MLFIYLLDRCSINPCQNEGSCASNGQQLCSCQGAFVKKYCEINAGRFTQKYIVNFINIDILKDFMDEY